MQTENQAAENCFAENCFAENCFAANCFAANCFAVNSAAALIPIRRKQGEDTRVNQEAQKIALNIGGEPYLA
jgi:hypothetical protein